jgi:hypothetical protein
MPQTKAQRQWYLRNRERLISKACKRQKEHINEIREQRKTSEAKAKRKPFEERYRWTPQQRVYHAGLSALSEFLTGRRFSGKWLNLLGCSIVTWKAHLQNQFEPWMTWENRGHGKGCWQIDHIAPAEMFDLTNPSHLRTFFHWSNTRPICAVKNVSRRFYE